MTLPDVHLAAEAIAAYVDGELAPTPADRAATHLARCRECRVAVAEQRQAKLALGVAETPDPSADLLARLHEIPMTADIGGSDVMLAVDGDEVVWRRQSRHGEQHRNTRPPASRPPSAHVTRRRRTLRLRLLGPGLAAAAAAVVVGVLVSVSSWSGGGGSQTPDLPAPARPAGTVTNAPPSNPPGGNVVPVLVRPLVLAR